jgi:hypothetical protein
MKGIVLDLPPRVARYAPCPGNTKSTRARWPTNGLRSNQASSRMTAPWPKSRAVATTAGSIDSQVSQVFSRVFCGFQGCQALAAAAAAAHAGARGARQHACRRVAPGA